MPPVLIAGVAAAAIGAGGTYLASKSNSKAIKKATAAQQTSEAQQIGFQREARAQNTAALSPSMTRGNIAGDTINAALGIGGGFAPQTAPQGALTVQSPYTGADPSAMMSPGMAAGYNAQNPTQSRMAALDAYPIQDWGMGQGALAPQAQVQPQNPAQAATAAYELFKQSTGYTSRIQEGQRQLASNYFGGGVGQSGAAVKAALRYGQNFASNEFGNWLGYLGNQQGLGFAGASALAGVSQGAADRMGDISQRSADTASQAAIARAQNQGALYTGLAGIAGQAAGALSSYSRPQAFQPALRSGWGTPAYY